MGITYRSSYSINRKNYDYWNDLMDRGEIDLYEEGLQSNDCVAKYVVKFGSNDYEMEIQVCTSEDDVWCQAVLFDDDGHELCHTDVDFSLKGDWELEYNDDTYVVSLIPFDN